MPNNPGYSHDQVVGDIKLRQCPPPPKDFDPVTASEKDLIHYGLPLRPDPYSQPGMAALWARHASRYRHFEHLEPPDDIATLIKSPVLPAFPFLGPTSTQSCGYESWSFTEPFTALFITWTIPNLIYSPSPHDPVSRFHTFVGLGFLDVHVDMTVDPQGNVTSSLPLATNLAVRPGDVLSASLCLNAPTSAAYFLANETTGQNVSFSITGDALPPATFANAGVSRFVSSNEPPDFHPLARFGITYFDEISAYTRNGPQSLTAGQTVTMVSQNGRTLAMPERLTDFTFRSVFVSA